MSEQPRRRVIALNRETHRVAKLVATARGMTMSRWIAEKLAEEIASGTIGRDLAPNLSAQIERIQRQRAARVA